MLSSRLIKDLATRAGFDLCGVAPCRRLTEHETHFRRWLAEGRQASLGYMERYMDKRFDPRALVPGAQTAVVCAVGYRNAVSEGYEAGRGTRIASYACCRDYHDPIHEMLTGMLTALQRLYPRLKGRAFVDTAPLLEKQWAVEAGLGWIGRQSLLVTPSHGSFVLLGELVLTLPVDEYDVPFEGARCGRCRNCVESCPTGAIVEPRTIDARRCISCRTQYETEGEALSGWILGCDECQSCCPYNRKAPMHRSPRFDPVFDPREISTGQWLAMSEEEFATRFAGTPLVRIGLERLRRNAGRSF